MLHQTLIGAVFEGAPPSDQVAAPVAKPASEDGTTATAEGATRSAAKFSSATTSTSTEASAFSAEPLADQETFPVVEWDVEL